MIQVQEDVNSFRFRSCWFRSPVGRASSPLHQNPEQAELKEVLNLSLASCVLSFILLLSFIMAQAQGSQVEQTYTGLDNFDKLVSNLPFRWMVLLPIPDQMTDLQQKFFTKLDSTFSTDTHQLAIPSKPSNDGYIKLQTLRDTDQPEIWKRRYWLFRWMGPESEIG